jgi:hypothetical protein
VTLSHFDVLRLSDEERDALPEISRHEYPVAAPQEYDCGCIAVLRVTARYRVDRPFEMALAIPCDKHGTPACEVTQELEARKLAETPVPL